MVKLNRTVGRKKEGAKRKGERIKPYKVKA